MRCVMVADREEEGLLSRAGLEALLSGLIDVFYGLCAALTASLPIISRETNTPPLPG